MQSKVEETLNIIVDHTSVVFFFFTLIKLEQVTQQVFSI